MGAVFVDEANGSGQQGGESTRRRPFGFTLPELLVTFAVLAILATQALPSFSAFLQRRQVEGLSAQLVADWQYLRSSAVSRQRSLRLSVQTPSSGPGGCYVIHSGAADACTCSGGSASCSAGTELLRVVALPTDGQVRLRANVAMLLVDPRHGTVSPTGSIDIIATQGDTLRHVVNILGRLRVCAAAGRWPGVPAC